MKKEQTLTSGYSEVYENSPIKPRIVYGGEQALKEPKASAFVDQSRDSITPSKRDETSLERQQRKEYQLYFNQAMDVA